MRKDFQIAILLALSAIPAGVALMAAPEYIGLLKEHPAPFFWAGLLLASALIIAAIAVAVRGEASELKAGHARRTIAFAGMIICGIGVLVFSGVYFWPAHKLTLRDLFLHDFNILSAQKDFSVARSNENTTVLVRLYFDFQSGSKFLSYYIPMTRSTFDICRSIATHYRDEIAELESVPTAGKLPGDVAMKDARELPFSGRIYIYYEWEMTTPQTIEIRSEFNQNHLDLSLRGHDYLILREGK